MKVEFRKSFVKDLERVTVKGLKKRVKQTIKQVEQAHALHQIRDVKRLRGGEGYYRIRIGDYRVGLVAKADTVVFVRFLHRKDVYRYFP
ncbi:MAG: type II toxin-antitoxin system RelE/ParE family toxin [Sedimentisphaerales bacterium]